MVKSLKQQFIQKGSMAAFTVAAASFSLTGFAAACSNNWSGSDESKGYQSTYNWNDYSKHDNKQKDKKHGYDNRKHASVNHGNKYVSYASHDTTGWDEDSSDDWSGNTKTWDGDSHSADMGNGTANKEDWGNSDENDSKDYGRHEAQTTSWNENDDKSYARTDDEKDGDCDHQDNWGSGSASESEWSDAKSDGSGWKSDEGNWNEDNGNYEQQDAWAGDSQEDDANGWGGSVDSGDAEDVSYVVRYE